MNKPSNPQIYQPSKKPYGGNLKRYGTEPSITSPRGFAYKKIYQSPTGARRNFSPPKRNQSPPKRNQSPPRAGGNYRLARYNPKPINSKAPDLANRKALQAKKSNSLPKYQFTPAEIDKLRHGFNEIDLDGNGRLDKYEMNTFLQKNGLDITFTDLEYQLFSHDGETLDFEEFKNYISVTSQMETNPRVYYKCLFDYIDKDHSGGIDEDELMEFCQLVKSPITKAEAKKTIQELDDTHTGTINFGELCKYLGC